MELLTDGETGDCVLDSGFTVGRVGYGSVFWPGPLRISNIDLDEIVHFRYREVTVYPRADEKPPVGMGLNRRAEVSLERVWPSDRATREPITVIAHCPIS
jgi:nuclear pore complex protein Nup98-Nup96